MSDLSFEFEPSNSWPLRAMLLLAIFAGGTVSAACGDMLGSEPVLDSGEACMGASEDAASPRSDTDFSKPNSDYEWRDLRENLVPENWQPGETFQNRFRRAFFPREHLRPNDSSSEFWLYEGEHAVIDLGVWWAGEDLPAELNFDLMVFVDLKPVEFGLIEVDPDPDGEPFPSLEEAQSNA